MTHITVEFLLHIVDMLPQSNQPPQSINTIRGSASTVMNRPYTLQYQIIPKNRVSKLLLNNTICPVKPFVPDRVGQLSALYSVVIVVINEG